MDVKGKVTFSQWFCRCAEKRADIPTPIKLLEKGLLPTILPKAPGKADAPTPTKCREKGVFSMDFKKASAKKVFFQQVCEKPQEKQEIPTKRILKKRREKRIYQ